MKDDNEAWAEIVKNVVSEPKPVNKVANVAASIVALAAAVAVVAVLAAAVYWVWKLVLG